MDGAVVAAWAGVGLLSLTSIASAVGGYWASSRSRERSFTKLEGKVDSNVISIMDLKKDIGAVQKDVTETRERVSRIEGSLNSVGRRG